MPSTKFVVESTVPESFRVNKVKSMFDCQFDVIKKEFSVDIPIEQKKWNVGVIVGSSGRGKTTIAKKCFPEFNFFTGFDWSTDKTILDDFDGKFSPKQITEILSKVGFASPPDWLKPFAVLSNGQKMRAELARLILESEQPFIYDEFTSVVDRDVAKVGSYAISKFVKKADKQFIAVSCHHDILEWLEPDWIYDVNSSEFTWSCLRRPALEFSIRKAEQAEWQQFKEFHYLSHAHNKSAHKYICEYNQKPVAWCSVIVQPGSVKNLWRIHRIVVDPDFQGVGLGRAFLNQIAKIYVEKSFKISIVTSSPAFIHGLNSGKNWIMKRKPSRVKTISNNYGGLSKAKSDARLTASFSYVG